MYCKSREESRAQQNLANQGIHSFFPKIFKEKRLRGKKTTVEDALFPSYLFVFADAEHENFSRIRSTRGINDFVRFGPNIANIPAVQIELLKDLCHAHNKFQPEPELLLKNGDKVEISNGAFKGLTAIFDVKDGLERSMLLINILNQENQVSFKNSHLKKLES